MKKFYLLSLVIALFLTAGCTKNYKTVDEYIEAMQQVKAGYNNTYTIDAVVDIKEPRKNTNGYYRSYVKNNKWKIEMSEDEGATFPSAMLYDGKEILIYSDDSPYAMVNPISMVLEMEKDPVKKEMMVNTQNPVMILYNWEKDFDIIPRETPLTGEFVNNNEVRNDIKCRLIKFGEEKEVCVSDKTGIAVYLQESATNPKNPNIKSTLTLNLKKFDTSDIPDSTFILPEGKKKMSFESILNDMSKMFKNMKKM